MTFAAGGGKTSRRRHTGNQTTQDMPVRPFSTAAAAAALLAACAAPRASHDVPPASVQSAVRLVVTAPTGAAPVVEAAFADARGGERRVGAADLRATAETPAPHSAWHPVAAEGTLNVRVSVAGRAGAALGGGALALALEPGWLWTVEALVHRPAAGVPAPPCFGCVAETRLPLRASVADGIAQGDSLFLRATRAPAAGRPPLPPS